MQNILLGVIAAAVIFMIFQQSQGTRQVTVVRGRRRPWWRRGYGYGRRGYGYGGYGYGHPYRGYGSYWRGGYY